MLNLQPLSNYQPAQSRSLAITQPLAIKSPIINSPLINSHAHLSSMRSSRADSLIAHAQGPIINTMLTETCKSDEFQTIASLFAASTLMLTADNYIELFQHNSDKDCDLSTLSVNHSLTITAEQAEYLRSFVRLASTLLGQLPSAFMVVDQNTDQNLLTQFLHSNKSVPLDSVANHCDQALQVPQLINFSSLQSDKLKHLFNFTLTDPKVIALQDILKTLFDVQTTNPEQFSPATPTALFELTTDAVFECFVQTLEKNQDYLLTSVQTSDELHSFKQNVKGKLLAQLQQPRSLVSLTNNDDIKTLIAQAGSQCPAIQATCQGFQITQDANGIAYAFKPEEKTIDEIQAMLFELFEYNLDFDCIDLCAMQCFRDHQQQVHPLHEVITLYVQNVTSHITLDPQIKTLINSLQFLNSILDTEDHTKPQIIDATSQADIKRFMGEYAQTQITKRLESTHFFKDQPAIIKSSHFAQQIFAQVIHALANNDLGDYWSQDQAVQELAQRLLILNRSDFQD